MGIDDNEVYLRYCIDEACAYLYNRIQQSENKELPIFDDERINRKHYNPGLDLLLGKV